MQVPEPARPAVIPARLNVSTMATRLHSAPSASGARQGLNDFRKVGYGGPCPPRGSNHRYFFKLYALNANLGLKAGATKAEVEKAIEGKIVAQAELMGRFGH